jgi:hypothetical protein
LNDEFAPPTESPARWLAPFGNKKAEEEAAHDGLESERDSQALSSRIFALATKGPVAVLFRTRRALKSRRRAPLTIFLTYRRSFEVVFLRGTCFAKDFWCSVLIPSVIKLTTNKGPVR